MSTLISKDKLSINIGKKIIIHESELIIISNTRYGLVGQNGCGKSTLLKYIENNLPLGIKSCIVSQDIEIDNTQTVMDFMLRSDIKMYDINKQIQLLESKENDLIDEELDIYNQLTSSIEYEEYDKYINLCKKILKGLGIDNHMAMVSSFSGGWRMRLSIAKSLIIEPDVLIMDEPTNHLDLCALIWLSNYLNTYKHTLIITSHQVEFINTFSNIILYIGSPDYKEPKLYSSKGTYLNLERMLNDISVVADKAYMKVESEINKLKKQSKSKKIIEEYINKCGIPRPPKKYNPIITFPEIASYYNRDAIRFDNVSFGYNTNMNTNMNTNNNLILSNTDLSINLKSRYLIIGPNGIGKTTLFKLCMGEIEPISGNIFKDSRIRIGYYNQHIIENLPLTLTPIEYLQSFDNKLDIGQCRSILGKIGIRKLDNDDPCQIMIKDLSGGQKARISFCRLQITQPHIILLDEPTNHLDIETIEGLIQGINEYEGGIIMITHDTYLISNINNMVLYELANKKLSIFGGDINDYIQKITSND
jgi:ATP-binding cassette subfamily F protein 1